MEEGEHDFEVRRPQAPLYSSCCTPVACVRLFALCVLGVVVVVVVVARMIAGCRTTLEECRTAPNGHCETVRRPRRSRLLIGRVASMWDMSNPKFWVKIGMGDLSPDLLLRQRFQAVF